MRFIPIALPYLEQGTFGFVPLTVNTSRFHVMHALTSLIFSIPSPQHSAVAPEQEVKQKWVVVRVQILGYRLW